MVESYRRYVGNCKALLREYKSGRVKFYSNNADMSAGEIDRIGRNIRDIESVIQELDPNRRGR
jgi:hypothetical protein